MKSIKHSKFEILPIEPNGHIGDVKTKRTLTHVDEIENFVKENADVYCFAIFDKKSDEFYGCISLEIDEWSGVATFDFNNVKNHSEDEAMYHLVRILCKLALSFSKNCKVFLIENHKFADKTLFLLKKEGFAKKSKDGESIFFRYEEMKQDTLLTMIFFFVLMLIIYAA